MNFKKIKTTIILVGIFLAIFVFASKLVQTAAAAATPVLANQYKYQTLEAFPGFFAAKASPDFPDLILALYKFGIWTVGIAGLFMLTIGGVMYMASAGNNATATSAKGIITDSLLGILAALCAYLVMYVINPDLTKIDISFTAAKVKETTGSEPEQVSGTVSAPGSLASRDGYQLDVAFVEALNKLQQNGIRAVVTSGLRPVEKQEQLITQNCGGLPPTKTCSPPTCLLKNGPSSCPHTTGKAADIWALNSSGAQAITQAQCMSNIQDCFNNQYQKALVSGMRAEGFCVLSSEPWHFEKPKMSSSCS